MNGPWEKTYGERNTILIAAALSSDALCAAIVMAAVMPHRVMANRLLAILARIILASQAPVDFALAKVLNGATGHGELHSLWTGVVGGVADAVGALLGRASGQGFNRLRLETLELAADGHLEELNDSQSSLQLD